MPDRGARRPRACRELTVTRWFAALCRRLCRLFLWNSAPDRPRGPCPAGGALLSSDRSRRRRMLRQNGFVARFAQFRMRGLEIHGVNRFRGPSGGKMGSFRILCFACLRGLQIDTIPNHGSARDRFRPAFGAVPVVPREPAVGCRIPVVGSGRGEFPGMVGCRFGAPLGCAMVLGLRSPWSGVRG